MTTVISRKLPGVATAHSMLGRFLPAFDLGELRSEDRRMGVSKMEREREKKSRESSYDTKLNSGLEMTSLDPHGQHH